MDLLVQLLYRYNDSTDSRAYLADVILCVHSVLRILSNLSKSSGLLYVARRVRARKQGVLHYFDFVSQIIPHIVVPKNADGVEVGEGAAAKNVPNTPTEAEKGAPAEAAANTEGTSEPKASDAMDLAQVRASIRRIY